MREPLRPLLNRVGKAIADYRMIGNGDRVALGLSGGKDSLTLLHVLNHFRRVAPVDFEVTAITVSMGLASEDFTALESHCARTGTPFHLERTQIGPIVLDVRRENNPCSLCANMRRGALHAAAKRLGCNKVALAHHLDDAVETLMMNILFSGRVSTFSPVTHLSRRDVIVVRPLVYCTEALVASTARSLALPVIPAACPVAGRTSRALVKEFISRTRAGNPSVDESILASMRRMWQQAPPSAHNCHDCHGPASTS